MLKGVGAADHDIVDVPLVVHVLHRFECGGLQTVLAECINRMPPERYRHAVVCLTGYTDYVDIIRAPGVTLHALDKPPGPGLGTHVKLWKLLRRLRPAIVHTYNISAIEYNLTALFAGVPVRVHAEHGRGNVEIDGRYRTYNLLRRLISPCIDAFVPVSDDLVDWLRLVVKVPSRRIRMIPNGVDTLRYAPAPAPFRDTGQSQHLWIGTVGRADRIKNHAVLLDAFQLLLERFPGSSFALRLAIVGDGPLLQALRDRVAVQGLGDKVWLPGARTDVADILRTFSIFVLPSLSEAMPVTILEAMATALPVVASRVGGVPGVVVDGKTGILVQPDDAQALADALGSYISDAGQRSAHGIAGRAHAEEGYGIDAMASAYASLYDDFRCQRGAGGKPGVPASAIDRTLS